MELKNLHEILVFLGREPEPEIFSAGGLSEPNPGPSRNEGRLERTQKLKRLLLEEKLSSKARLMRCYLD